jgi:hypothetical protein
MDFLVLACELLAMMVSPAEKQSYNAQRGGNQEECNRYDSEHI